MGLLQRLLDAIGFSKPQCKVLCVGLDNSGKSTVIQHLKPDKKVCGPTPPGVRLRKRCRRVWCGSAQPGVSPPACGHPSARSRQSPPWQQTSRRKTISMLIVCDGA